MVQLLRASMLRHDRILILCLCGLLGCRGGGDGPPEGGGQAPPAAAPQAGSGSAATERQVEKALAARDALFAELSGALTAAMAQGGPASAIEVCQKMAPDLAARVGQQQGVRLGRTGVRLRNPKNDAPDWAAPFVEQRIEEMRHVALDSGELGVLLPIHMQPHCLACHGPSDSLAEEVRQQLEALYPGDQAVEFAAGELRGWFWIEVPAERG